RGQRLALLDGEHERLFRIDMLAGIDPPLRNLVMSGGDGEIDHDVDVIRRKQAVHALLAKSKLLRPRLCRIRVHVRAGTHLDPAEVRRQTHIGRRDIAAANDAHSKFSGHVYVPQYRFCSAFTAAGAVGNSHLHRASKPWTSRAWRSLATAWLDLLKPARVLDRLAREALVIVRLVVLHNEKPGLRPVAHGVHDLFP